MYKKKQFLKLEKKYSSYQEKGSVGTMMELCHRKLENNEHFKQFNKNSKILEIGAGSSPHVKYVISLKLQKKKSLAANLIQLITKWSFQPQLKAWLL